MLFQLRTDSHIDNNDTLRADVRAEVEGAIGPRLGDKLRRVEVYLQDVNGPKKEIDTRCCLSAHLAGHQPVAVQAQAPGVEAAVRGAVDELLRALDHRLGRLADRGGRVSMSGEET